MGFDEAPPLIKIPLLLLGIFCLLVGASVSGGTALALGVGGSEDRPGLGLAALFFFDILVIYTFAMLAFQIVGLGAISGRVQFATALIVSILGLLGGIVLVTGAIAALTAMVALLLAVPFGTIVYMAIFGHFDTDASRAILSMVMLLKLVGLAMIAFATPGILNNRSVLVLSGVSVLFTFALGFLHAFPPNFLASIADAIGAIVFGIVGTIWMLLLLFSGLASLVRTIRGIVPA
jgi:hypothetical protein